MASGASSPRAGLGEWGRKMQDDISDALAMLVEQKFADPARVCIVGASYGGYAALAGATLTPELYKCVVSMPGIRQLAEFLKSRRKAYGEDSDVYAYWMRQIGDPERDASALPPCRPSRTWTASRRPSCWCTATRMKSSPTTSVEMKKLLDKSGRPTQLITLEDEGHSGWTEENERPC